MVIPQRLFVVAAHPDDDAIGCGGLIRQVAMSGGEVCVAYLSDGSRSHPASRRFPPTRLAQLRAAEACAALSALGVHEPPHFFELPDGALTALSAETRAAAVRRLANLLDCFAPGLLLAPWRRDPHPDHRAAAAITADAAENLSRHCMTAGYEVWLQVRGTPDDAPLPGEATLQTISLNQVVLESKRHAILAHRTQTSSMIDDDPDGFRIGADLLQQWLIPVERFHVYSSAVEYSALR